MINAASDTPYALARRAHRTRLTRRGPSPQRAAPATTPDGALRLTYSSAGMELTAFVTDDPHDGRAHPAVIFGHGGFAFGPDDWTMTAPLRCAGYAVMVPIVRGENGQPGDFTTFYDEVDDFVAAADALAKLPWVDPNRLFAAGHSAGGTLALLAAMAAPRFRAVAPLSAVMDQRIFARQSPVLIAYDPTDETELALRSPTDFPSSLRAPARVWYGDAEPWQGPPSHAFAAAANAHVPVTAAALPGNHNTFVPGALVEVVRFFDATAY